MSGVPEEIRVLHVDDQSDFLDLATTFLEREDDRIETVGATSVEEGLDVLASEPVDCVVSDYDMPGRDGLDFLRTVREEYGDLPFILFTGKGSEEVAEDAVSAGVTDYLQKGSGTDQYTILANRVVNAAEADAARRRAARQERINTLVREVNRKLVEAETVEEIEAAVCETLTGSESYRFAWIGEPDGDGELVARAAAEDAASYLDEIEVRYDDTPRGQGPAGRAVRTRDTELSQPIEANVTVDTWERATEEYGFESVVALPLVHDDHLHGVLTIYASDPYAFGETERNVLEELAETISEALAAAEVRRELETTRSRLDAILEKSNTPMFLKSADGEYLLANQAFADYFGLDREEVAGKTSYDLYPREVADSIAEYDRQVVETGDSLEYRGTVTVGDEERTFLVSKAPIYDTGDRADPERPVAVFTVANDVTDRENRERRLERLQAATRDLVEADTADRVATITSETAADVLDFPMNGVHFHDADAGGLAPAAVSDHSRKVLDEPPVLDEGLAWECFQEGAARVVDDVRDADAVYDLETPMRSEMYLPLGDHGVFIVSATETDAFTEADRTLAELLAATAASALDRIERAEQLSAERERRSALVENAPGPVVGTEIEDGRHVITDVNAAFEEVFGFEASAVVGEDIADALVPDRYDDTHGDIRERLAAGEPVERRVVRKTADGPREFLTHAIPYGTGDVAGMADGDGGATGTVEGAYAWYTELTGRDRDSPPDPVARRYETIVEASGDAVYTIDADGHFTFVNDRFTEVTGYEESEVLGEHVSLLLDEDAVERGREAVVSLLKSGESNATVEMEVTTADGERIVTENNIALLPFEEEFRGSVGVLRDITERKRRKQELERQNERLDEFTSVVSHDLRNPLNVASARLELARDDCDSEHLDDVGDALERMGGLIDDLMTVAKQGETATDAEPVALPTVTDRAWRSVETADATLSVEDAPTVRADPSRLQQLLENLVRNAVEHGGEDVTVTVGGLDGGFYVADDGPGIPPEDRDRVFETGYSTVEEGTGFGLNIVTEIAEAHGWEVGVADSEGGGARFEVTGVEVVGD